MSDNKCKPTTVKTLLICLPPTNEVWGKVMFLHLCVILFTGGGLHPGGLHPGGVCIGEGGGSASRGVCIQEAGGGQTPLSDTTGYSQLTGGTHPTGMHSCFKKETG